VLLAFFAVGCGARGLGKQTVVVKHYPQCYEPISTLREEAKQLSARIAQGAVGGALAGALAGALTGKTENILIGAAAGAVVGASVAYIVTSEVQAKNQEERFATYAQYMDEDYSTLNKAVSSARITANCYSNAYKQLEKDYKAGKMSKEEMKERVTEIRDGTVDAKEILQYYKDASVANIKQFEEVQKAEVARTVDKPNASRTRSYGQKLDKNKEVVTQAEVTDQILDTVLVQSEGFYQLVKNNIQQLIEYLASTDFKTQG
jgi:uncharacterized protein YcfJ